jgi:hypothetical protein
LQAVGILASRGSIGDCFDNAVAEAFFATLKVELLYRQTWPTRTAARLAIFEYIAVWYNRQRRHSTLGYVSPVAYEALDRQEASPNIHLSTKTDQDQRRLGPRWWTNCDGRRGSGWRRGGRHGKPPWPKGRRARRKGQRARRR